MKHWLWLMAGGFIALTACTPRTMTVYGVTPEHPKIWDPDSPTTVEGLRPLLRWKPPDWAGPNASYDLIIYEGVEVDAGFLWSRYLPWMKWTAGKEVYFRKELKEPEHQVEEVLRASTVYFWSLRVRVGEKVSDWSRYDYESRRCAGWSCISFEYAVPFFIFETPDK